MVRAFCFVTILGALYVSLHSLAPKKFLDAPVVSGPNLTFFDVGQGSFVEASLANKCMFFDAGGSRPLTQEQKLILAHDCAHKTVVIFLSHKDRDHVRNTPALLTSFPRAQIFTSHLFPIKGVNNLKEQVLSTAEPHPEPALTMYWPPPGYVKKTRAENDRSLVFTFHAGSVDLLSTGDMSSKVERLRRWPTVPILEVGHHGSRFSSSMEFLKQVRPQICVISSGLHNHYGHPNAEVLRRLNDIGCVVLRTDQWGTIRFELTD